MKANGKQIRIIHTLKSKLGMDEDTYRATLEGYGARSSTGLDYSAARDLINRLVLDAQAVGSWKQPAKRYDNLGDRPGMAAPAQLRKIEALWSDVSRAPTQPAKREALRTFIENHFGISALEWIPSEMVGKIVFTLKTMKRKAKSDGHNG